MWSLFDWKLILHRGLLNHQVQYFSSILAHTAVLFPGSQHRGHSLWRGGEQDQRRVRRNPQYSEYLSTKEEIRNQREKITESQYSEWFGKKKD